MKHVTGLIGRDALIEAIAREARKGRHLLLTGRPGIGKSTMLEAVIDRLIVRRDLTLIHVTEH
jgi:MoxR-like ATPase